MVRGFPVTEDAHQRWRPRPEHLAWFVALICGVAPLWAAQALPLVDLPQHLHLMVEGLVQAGLEVSRRDLLLGTVTLAVETALAPAGDVEEADDRDVAGREEGADRLEVAAQHQALAQRRGGRQLRFLLDEDHAYAVGQAQHAVIERNHARDHTQQRGLAGAVAPDQRDPFAGIDRQVDAIEQRDVAEGEVGGITDFDAQYRALINTVKGDIALATILGVKVTPTFYINGVKLEGALPPQYMELALQLELKKAGKSQ